MTDERTGNSLLTVHEVAAYLRVSEKTVRRLNIPYAKVGKVRRYRWSDLQDFLEAKVA